MSDLVQWVRLRRRTSKDPGVQDDSSKDCKQRDTSLRRRHRHGLKNKMPWPADNCKTTAQPAIKHRANGA